MQNQYGILFSHASQTVTPGLVDGPYTDLNKAVDWADRVVRSQGVEYVIMSRSGDLQSWTDPRTGLDAVSTIRARWV